LKKGETLPHWQPHCWQTERFDIMAWLTEPSLVGKKQDIADYISIADAASTPFTSMAAKGKKLGNALFSWQADIYGTPVTTGTVDGSDVTYANLTNAVANRGELKNYGQWFRRDCRVSPLVDEVSEVAGSADELANSVAKRIVELKRDIEKTMLSANSCQADNGTLPYLTRGLDKWLVVSGSADATLPQGANFCLDATQIDAATGIGAVTDTTLQNVLKGVFDINGAVRDYDMICGTAVKRAITDMVIGKTTVVNQPTSIRTLDAQLEGRTFTSAIDVFQGDFGNLRVHADLYTADTKYAYLCPMEYIELRYGVLPRVKQLPDLGGGPPRLIEAFAGLVVKNPRAFGAFRFAA